MEQMTHEESSGNVFADLGLPNSEQELVKAKLTVQIYQILRARKCQPQSLCCPPVLCRSRKPWPHRRQSCRPATGLSGLG